MKRIYTQTLCTAALGLTLAAVPALAHPTVGAPEDRSGDATPSVSHTAAVASPTDGEDSGAGAKRKRTRPREKRGLTIGGYGEAVTSRYFYTDQYTRYAQPEKYRHVKSRGEFDMPHVTFLIGYDFGRGWKMNAEIEYEHGGAGSAMEVEANEGGEFESEIEQGGEVELEQFWIEKSWSDALNLRMGHIIVPVGGLNNHHEPDKFFTVYRPEEEASILPSTWHQTGVSLWGRAGDWRYEMLIIQGLAADKFSDANWIKNGHKSAFEFGRSTQYAVAARVDNYSLPGLRVAASGYYGGSARNTTKYERYGSAHGRVGIGAVDFTYDAHNWIIRGNFDYGHLEDSRAISAVNKNYPKASGCPRTNVASDVMAYAIEAGYDVFSQFRKTRGRQNLYVFGHYGFYDSMHKTEGNITDLHYYNRRIVAAGLNYRPIPQITIKAEYSNRLLHAPYNNEQAVSLGVTYTGLFNL